MEGSWVKKIETNGKNKIQRTNGKNDGPGLREAPKEKPGMHVCIGHGRTASKAAETPRRAIANLLLYLFQNIFYPTP